MPGGAAHHDSLWPHSFGIPFSTAFFAIICTPRRPGASLARDVLPPASAARHRHLPARRPDPGRGVAVGLLAALLRARGPLPLGIPSLAFHLWVGAVLTPVGLLVLRTFRLYRSARTASLSHELFVLTEGVLVIAALAGLGSFFARGELPRTVVLLFALLAIAGLWTARIVLRVYL